MQENAVADLVMVAGDCHVGAMLPQPRLVPHVLYSFPEVLTHQKHHYINQRLCPILAEEGWTPMQHLLLQGHRDDRGLGARLGTYFIGGPVVCLHGAN